MSALPPKADIGTQSWNVRFVAREASLALARLAQPEAPKKLQNVMAITDVLGLF